MSTTPNIGTSEPRKAAKQTMLLVAEECDKFAIKAAMCSIYELVVSRITDC
jgi:hypothetical protein